MKNIVSFLLMIVILGCQSKKAANLAEKKEVENQIVLTTKQLKNADLFFGNLHQQTVNSTLKVNGKIILSPDAIASVSIPLGGYVKLIKVMPGMQVRKGQLLAVVEDLAYVQLQQEYLNTKQQLAFTYKDYQRQKELNALMASSDKNYQSTENEYLKNKILLKSLEEKLRLIQINPSILTGSNISKSVKIVAPISGMLTQVNVNLGKYTNATDALFQIMNTKKMYAQLQIFDKDIANLFVGQQLKIFTNAQPETIYNTSIQFVNKRLNDNENSVEAYAKINNNSNKLIPGNYVNALIESKNERAWVVNNNAIVNYEGKNYVFVQQKKNTYQMMEVEVGVISKQFTEIINFEELKNKKIVTQNAYTLLMTLKNKKE